MWEHCSLRIMIESWPPFIIDDVRSQDIEDDDVIDHPLIYIFIITMEEDDRISSMAVRE